ncbi:hypothetical protein MTO96_043326 [Rhipicephalus appendiculatus]
MQRPDVEQGQRKLVFPDPFKGGPASPVIHFVTTSGPEPLRAVSRRESEGKGRYAAVMSRYRRLHTQVARSRRDPVSVGEAVGAASATQGCAERLGR